MDRSPVGAALDLLGDRWTLLILRDAFYGVRRFEDFHRDLGIARNILTSRLNELVDRGILERHLYEERPPRHEYRLSEKGRDLLPVVLAMMRWGDRWAASTGDTPPVTLTHTTCGHETTPLVSCSHCGDELRLREVRAHPIPLRGVESPAGALADAS